MTVAVVTEAREPGRAGEAPSFAGESALASLTRRAGRRRDSASRPGGSGPSPWLASPRPTVRFASGPGGNRDFRVSVQAALRLPGQACGLTERRSRIAVAAG